MNEHSNETLSDDSVTTDHAETTDHADGGLAQTDSKGDLGAAGTGTTEHRAAAARGTEVGSGRVRTNDYVPPDHGDTGGTPQWFGMALGALLVVAAIAAALFVYSSDDTDASSLVARRADPTPVATATPEAAPTPTAEPTVAPTAVPSEPEPITVYDRAAAAYQFSTLADAAATVGLAGELASRSPITVFAPTDAAFADVDLSAFSESDIQQILSYHVVDGLYASDDLNVGGSIETITGEAVRINDDYVVNDTATIIDTDIEASNGVIHAIDAVLIPRAFRPTVGELVDNDTRQLSALGGAVAAMGLRDALDQEGPITVFAPVDAAFGDAGELLAASDAEDTTAVLAYHVVPGEYLSSDLSVGQELTTVQGETIVITEGLTLNSRASIEVADILASNGVVHKIDGVLLPGTLRTEQALNNLFSLDPIQFETASARILSESEPVLDQAIEILTANATGAVEIEGHTDSVGGESSNESLSQRRAESVLDYLTEGGVDADRLTAVGYGESRLKIEPETSAADRQQNRRIEFRVG